MCSSEITPQHARLRSCAPPHILFMSEFEAVLRNNNPLHARRRVTVPWQRLLCTRPRSSATQKKERGTLIVQHGGCAPQQQTSLCPTWKLCFSTTSCPRKVTLLLVSNAKTTLCKKNSTSKHRGCATRTKTTVCLHVGWSPLQQFSVCPTWRLYCVFFLQRKANYHRFSSRRGDTNEHNQVLWNKNYDKLIWKLERCDKLRVLKPCISLIIKSM